MPNPIQRLAAKILGNNHAEKPAEPRVGEAEHHSASAIETREVCTDERFQRVRDILNTCDEQAVLKNPFSFEQVKETVAMFRETGETHELVSLFEEKIAKMDKKPKTQEEQYHAKHILYKTSDIDEKINAFFN